MLQELPVTLRHLSEFPSIPTVAETGTTYEYNATLKALAYAAQTGICAIGDDSGLEVDALDGSPGVLSARFGGENASDEDRTQKLLRELLARPDRERTARFVCCIVFAGWSSGSCLTAAGAEAPRVLNVSLGVCEGTIATEPRGTQGFGYDPVFIPTGFSATFGELSANVKARLSHRAKALSDTRTFLDHFLKST